MTLTVLAAMAELFAEVLGDDTTAVLVAGLARMVAGRVVEDVVVAGVFFELDFAAVHGPQPVLLLLLPGGRGVLLSSIGGQLRGLLQGEVVHLLTGLGHDGLGNRTEIVEENFLEGTEHGGLRPQPVLSPLQGLVQKAPLFVHRARVDVLAAAVVGFAVRVFGGISLLGVGGRRGARVAVGDGIVAGAASGHHRTAAIC